MKDFMEFISIPVMLLFSMVGLFMSFFARVFMTGRKTIEEGEQITYVSRTKLTPKRSSILPVGNIEPNIRHICGTYDLRVSLELLKHKLCVLKEITITRKIFHFNKYTYCSNVCNDYYVFALRHIIV